MPEVDKEGKDYCLDVPAANDGFFLKGCNSLDWGMKNRFSRIFNPVSQSVRHDPEGKHIRSLVPELEQVPDQYIHEPWKMPDEVQSQAHCILGQTYPKPIVDHHWARERALAAFKEAKE